MTLPPGHSGFFSAPAQTLDPDLFDGMQLKPVVRHWLVSTLTSGLRRYLDLTGADEWLHAWLAGSGITYQWAGDRGATGDLDVLFGVDMQAFTRLNPEYSGLPESYVADRADEVLRQKLWPATAHQVFGQQTYEVTFFWSAETGKDITRIHPYAAYDLKSDVWVVPPPTLPSDPHAIYPGDWYAAAGQDVDAAETIASRHGSLLDQLSSTALGSPQARNIMVQLQNVRGSARSLFDDIHLGRREAFGEQGHGYGDWHNFRWQHAKASGVVGALSAIKAAEDADTLATKEFINRSIDGPETILTRDMLRYGKTP